MPRPKLQTGARSVARSADTAASIHRSNRLLGAISPADFERLSRHMEIVPLDHRQVLSESGGALSHAYFPLSGAICQLALTEETGSTETTAVGAEGVAGLETLLDPAALTPQMLVQVSGQATTIPVRHLRNLYEQSAAFRGVINRYARARMTQLSQAVACNGLHGVEQRCARWLLLAHDHAKRDTFDVTQEFLAEMLGVHRPSVTIVARNMQHAGLIQYSRGVVTVTDRKGLEAASCECYGVLRNTFDELSPGKRR